MSKATELKSAWQEQGETKDGPGRQAASDYIPSDFANFSFFEDRTVDKLMQVVISLGAEFWVMRRRMLVTEALLDKGTIVTTAQIEQYVPTADEQSAWEEERDIFIKRAYEALTTEGSPVGSAQPKTDRK
jgi:hypothetical protein